MGEMFQSKGIWLLLDEKDFLNKSTFQDLKKMKQLCFQRATYAVCFWTFILGIEWVTLVLLSWNLHQKQ